MGVDTGTVFCIYSNNKRNLIYMKNLIEGIEEYVYDFFVKAYLAGISDLFVISSTITAV